MRTHQIIVIIVGVLLVIFLYQLPRVAVENDVITDVMPHELNVSDADNEVIISLRNQIGSSSSKEKSINFADSLASVYLKYQLVDSAEAYARLVLNLDSSFFGRYRAGMIYYKAFQTASDEKKAAGLGSKTRDILERLMLEDSSNMSLRNKFAMTLVVSENPMQGIMMLREILEQEPENREAIFNLGLLAIRSGQMDRARDRFIKLIEMNESDHEAHFYLGVVYVETGESAEGIKTFKRYLEFEEANKALKATASNYIKELESI
ncbi:MAG: tetratricopeptide repeat protein [Cyclobacteriaceae bacterium]